jgi:uncharacterized membrane protein
MKKKDFLSILEQKLAKLPESERSDIISDYAEHFSIGTEAGKTEEEISRALGDPRRIAATYLTEVYAKRMQQAKSPLSLFSNSLYFVFAALGLGIFNVMFVIGPYFAALGILLVLWIIPVVVLGVAVGYFVVVIKLWGVAAFSTLFGLGIAIWGIGIFAIGGMAVILAGYLSYWFTVASLKYLQLNTRILSAGVKV